MTTLTTLLSRAVRVINKENDIKLQKRAELGDADKGAGVYRDQEYNEYRVIHIADGEHLTRADYHTSDLDDAMASAKLYINKHEGEPFMGALTQDELDAAAKEVQEEKVELIKASAPVRSRPRGYHSHPSPLLAGLLMRSPYLNK